MFFESKYHAYRQGCEDTRREAERSLAVLREELANRQRLLDAATQRADDLAERLAYASGGGVRLASPPPSSIQRALAGALKDSPFEDLPLGHPEGTFAAPEEAALVNGKVE